MESATGMEGSKQGNILGNEASKPTSDFAAPEQASDPVVYKLVRVDFDGTLVPATDNELMEVEDFFDYENSQILSASDAGFGFGNDDLPDKHLSREVGAFSEFENSKDGEEQLNSNVECDDDMIQIVAEEERHQAASDLPVHPSTQVNIGKPHFDQHENLNVMESKDPSEIPVGGMLSTPGSTLHDIGTNPSGSHRDQHENLNVMESKDPSEIPLGGMLSTSGSTLHDIGTNPYGSHRDSLHMQDEVTKNETSASNVSTSLKPDFSLLRGEINLDNFTIRGLQETFRATFGRETTVKDKQWLKRRIAMGLVNSCDIPMRSFTIKDNKLVKNVGDEKCEKVDAVLVGDTGLSGDAMKDLYVDSDNKTEDAKSTGLRSLLAENAPDDNSPIDQRAAKRVRKPTKRYIEEISDLETEEAVERPIAPDKHSGVIEDSSSSAVRPSWKGRSSSIGIIMRTDLLWGSGFQVPRVSRIRRCRPRKGIITLTPCGLEAELVKDAAKVDDIQLDEIGGQQVSEGRAVSFTELPRDEEKSEKLCSEIDDVAQNQMAEELQEHISADSSGNNSNGDLTAKGGTRRKHHRAWSLSEVVKLVDGVSRYGVGRWSEIKRVSFASYSHRTSVDLKDKWRNLLKASLAAMSSDKGMSHRQEQPQQRKPTSMPIPTPILLKVRELAEMNGQVPRNFKASSGNGRAGVVEN